MLLAAVRANEVHAARALLLMLHSSLDAARVRMSSSICGTSCSGRAFDIGFASSSE